MHNFLYIQIHSRSRIKYMSLSYFICQKYLLFSIKRSLEMKKIAERFSDLFFHFSGQETFALIFLLRGTFFSTVAQRYKSKKLFSYCCVSLTRLFTFPLQSSNCSLTEASFSSAKIRNTRSKGYIICP